jgi:hypothetical protein
MPFFAPTQEEERSFLSVLRHTVLEGPLRLVRFSDSSRGHKAAYGRKDPKTVAKFQPKISASMQKHSGRHTTNSYPGGSLQLVLRLDEEACGWISGPIRTQNLSAKKLRNSGS